MDEGTDAIGGLSESGAFIWSVPKAERHAAVCTEHAFVLQGLCPSPTTFTKNCHV